MKGRLRGYNVLSRAEVSLVGANVDLRTQKPYVNHEGYDFNIYYSILVSTEGIICEECGSGYDDPIVVFPR